MRFFRKRTHFNHDIAPDEIFLDSKNLPEFDRHQFEGRLEHPISWKSIVFAGIFFLMIGSIFGGRLWYLQIARGAAFAERSENNSLRHTLLFADRGVIFDRNEKLLAWNVDNPEEPDFSLRKYATTTGLSNVLGYIKYPSRDAAGFYYNEDYVGKDGVEHYYNDVLRGKNGTMIIETDARGRIKSQSAMNKPLNGTNVELSIDSRLQSALYDIISKTARAHNFAGGAGVMIDVETGEVIADVSYPEYSSQVMTDGTNSELIQKYFNDKSTPMLSRSSAGLYAPGSIVKPFMALAALDTGVITDDKVLYTEGKIVVPNPYDPDNPSVFRDWKNHGAVDMREALAQSSDVYFYEVGGGFERQKGMGISNIEKYGRMFGFGQDVGSGFFGMQKGTIPNPVWKAETFDGEAWRVGNTYHSVIGQYGWQVTPLQAARGIAAIANYGTLVKPTILKNDRSMSEQASTIDIPRSYFDVVHEGMRRAVVQGTITNLNMSEVEVAAKTGTAQIGVNNSHYNSWAVGFFPYKNPKYAFAIVMEKGVLGGTVGAPAVAREFFDQMIEHAPEYIHPL